MAMAYMGKSFGLSAHQPDFPEYPRDEPEAEPWDSTPSGEQIADMAEEKIMRDIRLAIAAAWVNGPAAKPLARNTGTTVTQELDDLVKWVMHGKV